MRVRALTVTEVNVYLKRVINQDPIMSNVQVRGEVSNFKLHSSGHAYFSIKDNESKLNCVMFKQSAAGLDFKPADGMSIIAQGRISVYERDGKYQLYVENMVNEGKGDLYLKFEELKKKLSKEGYFDESIKKKLPFLPERIGIVTSPTGAAIRDILSVLSRRNTSPEILIYPTRVQGIGASEEIAKGIEFFNSKNDVDVIIIARGGGAIEELWAFNERVVADALFKSRIPVISGVGHETDFTISDFVSDCRAATPSAAAELAVPDREEVLKYLNYLENQMVLSLKRKMEVLKNKLEQCEPQTIFRSFTQRILNSQQELDYLYDSLVKGMDLSLMALKNKLQLYGQSLNQLSPLNQLENGYAIVTDRNKNALSSVEQISEKEILDIYLKNGKLEVLVNQCIKGATWNEKK